MQIIFTVRVGVIAILSGPGTLFTSALSVILALTLQRRWQGIGTPFVSEANFDEKEKPDIRGRHSLHVIVESAGFILAGVTTEPTIIAACRQSCTEGKTYPLCVFMLFAAFPKGGLQGEYVRHSEHFVLLL